MQSFFSPAAAAETLQRWDVKEPAIMEIQGRLDVLNAAEIEEDVRLCIESGARDMVLDCAMLEALTGAGLRAMLAMARAMKQAGGKLSIFGLNGQPLEIYQACGYDQIIPVNTNLDVASLRPVEQQVA
jgi:anti-anti-sigma factor